MTTTPVPLAHETKTSERAEGPIKTSGDITSTPEFSIKFPNTEESGEEEVYYVFKHTDQTFRVKAHSPSEAVGKVAIGVTDDVELINERVTFDAGDDLEYDGEGEEEGE